MNLRYFLCALFVLFSIGSKAQLETSIWYFGLNAGLDFRSGNPIPLLDGEVFTIEGSATISDTAGNLLFYTDGSTVWDRNHDIMPNGEDLEGCTSATNSGIIIPAPGQPNIFYVFTAGCIGFNLGVRYSVVDLGGNGGLGMVTTKNIPLLIPATERLSAVQHANGTDYWVVTRDMQQSYHAFEVSAAGVNTVPVISTLGIDLSPYNAINGRHAGTFKFSPDGSKAAIAYWDVDGIVEWFDFDNATGVLSNVRTIFNTVDPTNPYGVEFSQSGRYLYVSEFGPSLYQFDTENPGVDPVEIYRQSGSVMEFGALQLAVDGKIYLAQYFGEYLSVIDNPEGAGAASNFQYQGVFLNGRLSQLGLPPFIQSFFFVGDIEAENLCFGETTEFSIDVSEPITNIAWDFGDGTTSNLENPTHVYATPGTYTVTAVVSTASETTTETTEITISEVPVANSAGPIEGCTSYGSYNLDLPSFDPTFLGVQDPNEFAVSYHLSQTDADTNTNALSGVHVFDYGVTPVYVRVFNRGNPLCYDTTQFDVVARQAPLVDTVTDWIVCDDDFDGQYLFDFSLKNDEIFNGQDTVLFELLYFGSQADADTGTNPLPNPYTNTLALEEVFFRFQNRTYTTCFRTGSFSIQVLDGVEANTPVDLQYCDDNNDGQAVFDLTQTEAEIIGPQDPNILQISFHLSQADADAGTNAVDASNYVSTAYETTIYVRTVHVSNASCSDTTSFALRIFDTPIAPEIEDWQICDDNNDGRYGFNLTEKGLEITNGLSEVTVSFHATLEEAQTSINPITGSYENTANPQTIYFRLENSTHTQCFTTGSILLQVFDTPTAFTPENIVLCDTDETGRYVFDLSQKDVEVLNGQDDGFYEVSYHSTELNALNNIDPIPKMTYQNGNLNEVIWVRVQHNQLNFCYDVGSFGLTINPLPQPNLEETYVICPDSPELMINGGLFETYQWRNANGDIIGTDATLTVLELGQYSLTVTETSLGVTCENTHDFEVLSSGAPESFTVEMSDFSDQITLTVYAEGVGDFEYSINGIDYQTNPTFEVFPGQYTVFVRDPLECRVLTQDIVAMGYQKFFTPNNDGNNDTWNIIGGDQYPNANLIIFDRYGKLLRQLEINGAGWDGSYLGKQMPASDYWFRYEYDNGKVFTGHFALKR